MKSIFFILGVVFLTNCSSQKVVNTKVLTRDSLAAVVRNGQDSILMTEPACVQEMIAKFKAEEKQNPPRSVYSYIYNEKKVYYVPPICCDFFSDLYDDQCKLIGHPDGGFTGRGDGKITDFKEKRSEGKLIWNDDRK